MDPSGFASPCNRAVDHPIAAHFAFQQWGCFRQDEMEKLRCPIQCHYSYIVTSILFGYFGNYRSRHWCILLSECDLRIIKRKIQISFLSIYLFRVASDRDGGVDTVSSDFEEDFERGDLMQWSLDCDFIFGFAGTDPHSLLHREVSSGHHLDDPIVYRASRLPYLANPNRFWQNDYEMSVANSESNLKLIKIAGRYSYPGFLLDGRSFSDAIWIDITYGADSTKVGVKNVLEGIKLESNMEVSAYESRR